MSMTLRDRENADAVASIQQPPTRPSHIVEVYAEMFNLLEEYAPSWYTEDLHRRASAGLNELKANLGISGR